MLKLLGKDTFDLLKETGYDVSLIKWSLLTIREFRCLFSTVLMTGVSELPSS